MINQKFKSKLLIYTEENRLGQEEGRCSTIYSAYAMFDDYYNSKNIAS